MKCTTSQSQLALIQCAHTQNSERSLSRCLCLWRFRQQPFFCYLKMKNWNENSMICMQRTLRAPTWARGWGPVKRRRKNRIPFSVRLLWWHTIDHQIRKSGKIDSKLSVENGIVDMRAYCGQWMAENRQQTRIHQSAGSRPINLAMNLIFCVR